MINVKVKQNSANGRYLEAQLQKRELNMQLNYRYVIWRMAKEADKTNYKTTIRAQVQNGINVH